MPLENPLLESCVIARIDLADKKKLDDISRKQGITKSTLIRAALSEYLKKEVVAGTLAG